MPKDDKIQLLLSETEADFVFKAIETSKKDIAHLEELDDFKVC